VKKITGMDLFNFSDFEEVLMWEVNWVKNSLVRLEPGGDDSNNFPWCTCSDIAYQMCSVCLYGSRHGKCVVGGIGITNPINKDSHYYGIISEIQRKHPHVNSLSQVPEINSLIRRVDQTYDVLSKMQRLRSLSKE